MSDHPDQGSATTSEVDDEFERLGRTAGSELRTPPPRDGHRLVERTSYVRRATLATLTVGTTLAVVVGGLLVLTRDPHSRENDRPVDVTTTTHSVVTPTSLVPFVGTIGSFRVLADSRLEPKFPAAATWTGDEAIVLGINEAGGDRKSVV